MLGLKPLELVVILAIVLLLFGGSRIATLGGSLGQGIRNFKRGFNGEEDQNPPGPTPPGSLGQGGSDTRTATRTPASANKDA